MINRILKKPSIICLIIISLAILFSRFNLPKYKYNGYTQELTYDVVSYYLYLPMTIIYHDPGMRTDALDSLFSRYKFSPTLYQVHSTDSGSRVPNYTCGMSYFYFVPFLAGHVWALNSGYPADGFSFPYAFSISVGIYLFILTGLFILRKLLLEWFSETVVTISLIILFLGTNYFSEAIDDYLQPHAALFTLYAILLYATKKWHDSPSYFLAAIIGFAAGWLTLARPSDIICFLIPILWGVFNKQSFIHKIKLIGINYKKILVFILFSFLPFIPQFLYWNITTGNFIYYSYKNTEGFDFLEPHIWNVLFSFKKSLFIYTPLLILPLFGLFRLAKNNAGQKYLIIIFTLINFYLLSSWAVWWNGASFGMRYFVQSYAILSIPLCLSVKKILDLRIYRYPVFILISFLIFLNLFQTWQYVHWIIPDDRMNFIYYKACFLKTLVTNKEKRLMEEWRDTGPTETFDNEHEYIHYPIAYYNFENLNSTAIDSGLISKKIYLSSPNSCRLSKENIYYPTFRIRYDNLIKEKLDHVWLRVTLNYYSELDIKDNPAAIVINFPHNKYNLKYRAYHLQYFAFEKNKWNKINIDYMTPFPYSKKDTFEVYMWYRGNTELFIDNFRVDVYEKIVQLSR